MDPQEQGVGEQHAPADQDQNETSLQRQQAQQQQQQQTQQVHVQQQQQRAVQQQHQQQLPDRQQQTFQEQHRRQQLQLHQIQQQEFAQARAAQTHHAEVSAHQQFQSNVIMQRMQQQQQAVQQQQSPAPHHVVAPQPHPGMTRSASTIVPPGAGPAPVQSSSTSKLWEHFVKGEKMQKTNKFLAHCIYCRKVNKDSRTRGERRMMSAHLSTCAEAPEEARAEGLSISRELKMRRSLLTLGKKSKTAGMQAGPHGGVAVSPVGKRQRQRPSSMHPIAGPSGVQAAQDAMVAAAAAAAAAGTADPGGTGGPPYFDPGLGAPMSLTGDIPRTGSMNTSDNVRLYYEEAGNGHPLILIHDFAGSCKYFEANFRDLATNFRVIRYDQRGHGDSEKPQYGFHLHRLAADLHDIIEHFSLDRVALLGGGLGCSVMWAFVELYGQSQISALLFVDQSPYQMASSDGTWLLGSKRIFSEGSLAHMSAELKNNARGFHETNVRAGFTRIPTNVETSMYVNESLKAPEWFLSKLMTNHCHMDWRAVLPLVSCPALVIVGKKSKLFPWEGVAYAADNMPHAKLLAFEDGSHYLYIEEAMRFNNTVTAFLQSIVAGP